MKSKQYVNFIIYLIAKIKEDDIFALASQLAYYLIMSFFPFVMFIMTVVGSSDFSSEKILELMLTVLPRSVVDLTEETVFEVFNGSSKEILGFSFLATLWSASAGFRAVIKGVNKAYKYTERRSFIKRSLIAMLSVLALSIIVVMVLGLIVFGTIIGRYLREFIKFKIMAVVLIRIFRYAFVIIFMISIFTTIYVLAPSKHLKWKDGLPGAVFSTIGWMLASVGFSFYVNNFNNYSKFYGSLGAVFIMMTWIFLVSMIFIIGVEINCVIDKIKKI
ncbi:YihY/virulence factor BrkB family protein [Clostridium sp. BJN0001]|uniref:YihY/virulence factor BrkB family protein n=1 Tax=Clostridium sp. BJN0001 TaxID=2930219 RepID=UPI001FD28BE5|nr:YihY/virulence factor BrkB family protein [Clostridium sp. BJN0001]